ncbi:MAG TPA: hypothetical protein VFM32_08855, partial [Spongiibacteraceae bacterium]|nr:hypothetical protein [Spongiibacteraceae bacterium]
LAWLSKEGILQTDKPISKDTLPIEKVKMLGNLYFPELRENFLKITRIAYGMRQGIAEFRRDAHSAISALDSEAHTAILQKQSKSALAFYESLLSAEQEFSIEAEKLMRSTLDPTFKPTNTYT